MQDKAISSSRGVDARLVERMRQKRQRDTSHRSAQKLWDEELAERRAKQQALDARPWFVKLWEWVRL